MQRSYRTMQQLKGHHIMIDLPADFPENCTAEIAVLPLNPTNETAPPLSMREWLDRAWGCVPDFPDRTKSLPLDDIQSL
jgi:hypothetical protein